MNGVANKGPINKVTFELKFRHKPPEELGNGIWVEEGQVPEC